MINDIHELVVLVVFAYEVDMIFNSLWFWLKSHQTSSSLCNLCVLGVFVVDFANHRDTEDTEVAQRKQFANDFRASHCLCLNDGTIGNVPGKFCFAEDRLVIFNLSVIEFDNAVSDRVIPVVMTDHEHGLTPGFQLRQKF